MTRSSDMSGAAQRGGRGMQGIAAIVLAAGGARRMGRPKQLLEIGGRALVRRAVDAAAGVADAVWVVVGAGADAVAAALAGSGARIARNPDWTRGMASSIRCGVEAACAAAPPRALLLLLCDQPAVTTALLQRLAAHFAAGRGLAACEYAGALGPPALFGAQHFSALRGLRGDGGARALLEAPGAQVARVPFPEGALDVDTPADLRRAAQRWQRAGAG
ncbi:MAG: nucleotidyltransferase family protein [Deltaproteobacteria bacterium]|nr:nucleotidyltransferase family protein [Deltaproteobacteria bacterium]